MRSARVPPSASAGWPVAACVPAVELRAERAAFRSRGNSREIVTCEAPRSRSSSIAPLRGSAGGPFRGLCATNPCHERAVEHDCRDCRELESPCHALPGYSPTTRSAISCGPNSSAPRSAASAPRPPHVEALRSGRELGSDGFRRGQESSQRPRTQSRPSRRLRARRRRLRAQPVPATVRVGRRARPRS
jgi:hypothetical protein